jgi:hypothetical protein
MIIPGSGLGRDMDIICFSLDFLRQRAESIYVIHLWNCVVIPVVPPTWRACCHMHVVFGWSPGVVTMQMLAEVLDVGNMPWRQ